MSWDGLNLMEMFFLALVVMCVLFLFRVALQPIGEDEYPKMRKGPE